MSTVLTPELPVQIAQAAPRITVVGDVMLDVWLHGRSERLAREAPAPVVDLEPVGVPVERDPLPAGQLAVRTNGIEHRREPVMAGL